MRAFDLPGRSPVFATHAMAATSHPLATQTALDILQSGGNAMDAAIGACAVQCVVEPQSTGIGGDCFCMYAPKGSANLVAFNGSGRAAAALSVDELRSNGIDEIGLTSPHAVTIPGAVDAWAQLHADHGRMDWGDILSPAIQYARAGYPVAPRVRFDWENARTRVENEPSFVSVFMPNGDFPMVGEIHRQPALADTLDVLAKDGRDAFYNGDIASAITTYLGDKGGRLTPDDFAKYRGDYVTPIYADLPNARLHECPPNGQGIAALLLMNMLPYLGIDGLARNDPKRIHIELEACRLAYGARNIFVADPTFSDVPVTEILSDAYAARLASEIDPNRAGARADDVPLTPHNDTVYISVVDKDRNAVSFINTLFWGFGSGLLEPKTGVLLQNRGAGFSMDPKHPNALDGAKRPLHTIIPAMLTNDGRATMSFGVMGGEYQAFGHMQFLTAMMVDGMDIQEAMDAPRMMVDPITGVVDLEPPFGETIRAELREKGHVIADSCAPIGGSQAIAIDWHSGVLSAGSDPRKDGCASGY